MSDEDVNRLATALYASTDALLKCFREAKTECFKLREELHVGAGDDIVRLVRECEYDCGRGETAYAHCVEAVGFLTEMVLPELIDELETLVTELEECGVPGLKHGGSHGDVLGVAVKIREFAESVSVGQEWLSIRCLLGCLEDGSLGDYSLDADAIERVGSEALGSLEEVESACTEVLGDGDELRDAVSRLEAGDSGR